MKAVFMPLQRSAAATGAEILTAKAVSIAQAAIGEGLGTVYTLDNLEYRVDAP